MGTTRKAQEAHLIFLPPYSPDLNPIEQFFAKLEHLLRKTRPREVEATWRKAGQPRPVQATRLRQLSPQCRIWSV
jgi:transposase